MSEPIGLRCCAADLVRCGLVLSEHRREAIEARIVRLLLSLQRLLLTFEKMHHQFHGVARRGRLRPRRLEIFERARWLLMRVPLLLHLLCRSERMLIEIDHRVMHPEEARIDRLHFRPTIINTIQIQTANLMRRN